VLLFAGFIALVLLLILWAVVIAPGMTKKLFAKLQAEGWEPVPVDDAGLLSALEALRPFDLTDYVHDGGERWPATVKSALRRSGPTRYLVQIRVDSKDAFNDNQVSFATLALGVQEPGFPVSALYVLDGKTESRVKRSTEVLGLRRVESGLDPGFAGLFLVLDGGGGDARPPSALQQALLANAALFVLGAGESGRYLPRVSLRVAASGWALLVPEPITTDRQLRAFLDAADAVGQSLGPSR
jgi:hypothetical protein